MCTQVHPSRPYPNKGSSRLSNGESRPPSSTSSPQTSWLYVISIHNMDIDSLIITSMGVQCSNSHLAAMSSPPL